MSEMVTRLQGLLHRRTLVGVPMSETVGGWKLYESEAALQELSELGPELAPIVIEQFAELERLTAENARMGEALRQIAGNTFADWTLPRDIARAALQGCLRRSV